MKTIFFALLTVVLSHTVRAQVKINHLPNTQVKTITTGIEKIRIPFTQPPLLHSNGGWEKGPSAWQSSTNFPIDFRGGLLLLDRKTNGMVHYLSLNLRFKEAGSIAITANSMASSKAGANAWQQIFGKQGEVKTVTIITNEADFGTEINLFLKEFTPYRKTQVN